MKRFALKRWLGSFAATMAAAVLVVVGTQGCDSVGGSFLDKPPSTDVTKDTVFSDAEYTQRFLTGIYSTLPYGSIGTGPQVDDQTGINRAAIGHGSLESLTDINSTTVPWEDVLEQYYTGNYNATDEAPPGSGNYRRTKYGWFAGGLWQAVRKVEILKDNIDRVPGLSEERKQQMIAEAKVVKAFHYADAFRHLGGIPWINKVYGPNEDFEDEPRLTAMAMTDSITALLDEAIRHLPWRYDNPAIESGRFTKAGAMGLKVQTLLFSASPLFNSSQPYLRGEAAQKEYVWHGGYQKNLWQRTADAARTLIQGATANGYELVQASDETQAGYREAFQTAYYSRQSSEVLISIRRAYRSGGTWSRKWHLLAQVQRGGRNVTDNYVDMFPMADGTPIDESEEYDPSTPYENRDPRLYETVTMNGSDYQNRTYQIWRNGGKDWGGGTRTTGGSGYIMRKFVLDRQQSKNKVQHWPALRLPEIYLAYAEALNELYGGPTAEAYEYVNKVRNRVGLDDLPSGMSQEEFRQAVIRERALEFGYEEVRFFDMVRHKMAETFTKPLYGVKVMKTGANSFSYERFRIEPRYWQKPGNWSPKWYLSALPPTEIRKGYGLVQNPGW